jgi:hypothetical protein
MPDVEEIVELAVGAKELYTLDGSIALVDGDYIIQEDPVIFSGLYYKGNDTYLFVIDETGFESSLITP